MELQAMKPHERTLIELQAWCDAGLGDRGMSINYSPHTPSWINEIPHHWSVQIGRTDKEHYVGYGVSMPDAILNCCQKWQEA